MPELRSRDPRLLSYQRFSLSVLAALFLCPVSTLDAQDTARTAAVWAADSGRAATAACKVAQSLREEPRRYRCYVEALKETATEYIVRVREVPRDGTLPPPLSRSTVQIRKTDPSVTVTRIPDL